MKSLDELIKERTMGSEIPSYPFFRNETFVDEEGKEIHFQTVVIPVKDYIELIKDKSYEEGYSWGMQQTLDKIFGNEEE